MQMWFEITPYENASIVPLRYSFLPIWNKIVFWLKEMMEHDRYQREIQDLKAACHKAERDVEEEIEAFRWVGTI